MSVQIIRDVLVAVVGAQVGHYEPQKNWKDKYAVYGETGAPTEVYADDIPQELRLSGEILYFTMQEFDKTVDNICTALSEAGVSWSIVSIGYDQELKQLNYQIHWEVPCGAGEVYRQ